MAQYLEDARNLFYEAIKELERGKGAEDTYALRDAAEKAWGAMVQATNALIRKRGFPQPKTHRERRILLSTLEQLDPHIEALGLRDRFSAREKTLHEDCFYERICPIESLEKEIKEKVKSYIEDVERMSQIAPT